MVHSKGSRAEPSSAQPSSAQPTQKQEGAGAAPPAGAVASVEEQIDPVKIPPAGHAKAAAAQHGNQNRERAQSRHEHWAARFEVRRAELLPSVPADAPVHQPKLNKLMSAFLAEVGEEMAMKVMDVYFADPWARQRDPPCPLQAFLSEAVWRKHYSAAVRGRGVQPAKVKLCEIGLCREPAIERSGMWGDEAACEAHSQEWKRVRTAAYAANLDPAGEYERWLAEKGAPS